MIHKNHFRGGQGQFRWDGGWNRASIWVIMQCREHSARSECRTIIWFVL